MPGLRAQLPILSARVPELARRKRQLPRWLGKFPEYKIPATKIPQPEGPTGAGNNGLCNTGPAAPAGDRNQSSAGGGGGASGRPATSGDGGHRACRFGTRRGDSLPHVTLRGTFPLCPQWAQGCLSGAGTRSSSRGNLMKCGPGPGLTPPHRETGHSRGTRTGRRAGSWPLIPTGTLPGGVAGSSTPLAGTFLAPRAGPPLPQWPLHPRIPSLDTALLCWPPGTQASPRGRVAASMAPPAPGRTGGRPQVSRQRADLGPSLLAGTDPSSPGPTEAGSELTPSAPCQPDAPGLPEQLRKARGPAVTGGSTGSQEV